MVQLVNEKGMTDLVEGFGNIHNEDVKVLPVLKRFSQFQGDGKRRSFFFIFGHFR